MHPYGALQYVIQHVVHNIICLGIAVRLGSDASASAKVLHQQLNTCSSLLLSGSARLAHTILTIVFQFFFVFVCLLHLYKCVCVSFGNFGPPLTLLPGAGVFLFQLNTPVPCSLFRMLIIVDTFLKVILCLLSAFVFLCLISA